MIIGVFQMSGFTSNWAIYKPLTRKKKKKQKQEVLTEEIKQRLQLIEKTIR